LLREELAAQAERRRSTFARPGLKA
jgi:hypothetical protein